MNPLVNTGSIATPRFREIQEGDLDAIADLLTRGFAIRKRDYWMGGLHRLGIRSVPSGVPRYGYMMEHDNKPVGCLLHIYSTKMLDGHLVTCCNVSSWYFVPEFRNYAALLASTTQRREGVIYFNVTPAVSTWPILEVQGFKAYCRGQCFSFPFLSRNASRMRIEIVTPNTVGGLQNDELEMLKRHAGYGCLSLICHTEEETFPFIFFSLKKWRGIIPLPFLQLGYCRALGDYVKCAGALGRFLLSRGMLVVVSDANGPIIGVRGIYSEARGRKYFKGPFSPRLSDLADTELAIFGM